MFWKTLTILAGLVPALATIYVMLDLHKRGDIPQKKIELNTLAAFSPLSEIATLGDKAVLKLTVGDQIVDNLVISRVIFRNIGKSPILPSDFYKGISVEVNKPWKIVSVSKSSFFTSSLEFEWNRIDDRIFEAMPTLINPGDTVSANIYLTNTEYRSGFSSENKLEPKLTWKARIANLQAFTPAPDIFERIMNQFALIQLSGIGAIYTLFTSVFLFYLYIYLLRRSGFLVKFGNAEIITIIICGILSVTAAGTSSIYIFPSYIFEFSGIQHWFNLPPIFLHCAVFSYLVYKAKIFSRT